MEESQDQPDIVRDLMRGHVDKNTYRTDDNIQEMKGRYKVYLSKKEERGKVCL